MHGKDGCRQRTRPHTAGHLPEDEKEQNRGGSVQQHIGQVVPSSFQAIELAVQHEGDPGQRAPVTHMGVGKCPGDSLHAEPVGNLRILVYVGVVVVVDELKVDRLEEHHRHR